MTAIDMQVDDTAFQRALHQALQNLDRSADEVVADLGRKVAEDARRRAPRGATGKLARSIKSEPGRDFRGPYADVMVEPFYSSFVEWGTSSDPARPFFRPALEQARKPLRGFRL